MKRKLIFFPFDLFSHYLRCLELAEAVKEDFHILFASSEDPKSNKLINERGFAVVECKTIDAARMSLMESRLDHTWMNQEELEPIFLDQVRVLREHCPYLVISDFSITLGMAAEYAHVRCYALTIAHLSKYSRIVRKGPDFHPAIKISKKLHCPDALLNFMGMLGTRLEFRRMHKGIRKIRKKYMLQPRTDYLHELEAQHNFITDIEDFSPMKGLPGNYTYVGPVYFQNSATEDELLAKLDPNKQTILVSLGTFWSSDNLYALFNDPIFRVYNIVIAGQPKIKLVPEILQKSFVNLEAVLSKTDLLICHGGDATVYQSLSHGVPLLGLAFHGEQIWSLERVTRLQLGEVINLPMTPKEMNGIVHSWLEKKKYQKVRFSMFAQKISIKTTQCRFREALLHLNERTFCPFCNRATLDSSQEVVNVPSDVRRYQNQYFRVWRCASCQSLHSGRILDLTKYYQDYPYDKIGNNIFVEKAKRNLVRIVKGYGVRAGSSILFCGPLASLTQEVFCKYGLTDFNILSRPKDFSGQWIFPDKQYDFIILINWLDGIENPMLFLKKVVSCLKPGGRILIQSTDAARINLKRLKSFNHELHQPYRLHIIAKNAFLDLAKSAGLELVDYQCRHFGDTLYPFVNQRAIHARNKLMDEPMDPTISLSKMKFERWWNMSAYLLIGLFGGIFKKNSTMLTIFKPFQ